MASILLLKSLQSQHCHTLKSWGRIVKLVELSVRKHYIQSALKYIYFIKKKKTIPQ